MRFQEQRQNSTMPVLIRSDLLLENIENYMRTQLMIDRDSRLRGINIDYKPTTRYCHRVILTLLF